jgi:hypothetical protein
MRALAVVSLVGGWYVTRLPSHTENFWRPPSEPCQAEKGVPRNNPDTQSSQARPHDSSLSPHSSNSRAKQTSSHLPLNSPIPGLTGVPAVDPLHRYAWIEKSAFLDDGCGRPVRTPNSGDVAWTRGPSQRCVRICVMLWCFYGGSAAAGAGVHEELPIDWINQDRDSAEEGGSLPGDGKGGAGHHTAQVQGAGLRGWHFSRNDQQIKDLLQSRASI